MSMHSTEFEATQGGIELTTAILIYRQRARGYGSADSSATFASIHPVECRDGQPVIEAGAPLSRAHLRQWTAALGRTAAPEILPPNVLVANADMLIWWIPEQVRPAYFALSRPPKGLKALAVRTTVAVPYPAHLLVATRNALGVYALPANERPTADTPLLYSPILNVFVEGHLCWGNIRQPKAPTIAAMAEYEAALFDSWSTHPNPGQERTVTGKDGLVRLWDDLAARQAKRFPVKRLKPFLSRRRDASPTPLTLGSLLKGGAR